MDHKVIEHLLKDSIRKTLELDFFNCYSCNRVWAAWSYNTMGVEDFSSVSSGEEAFEEILNSVFNGIKDGSIKDFSTTNNFFYSLEYDFYYNENSNLSDNFSEESFYSDYYNYIDFEKTIEKTLNLIDFHESLSHKKDLNNITKISI